MSRPPNTDAITIVGEGPNGEDVIEYRDKKTKAVVGRDVIITDEGGSEVFRRREAVRAEDTEEPSGAPEGSSSRPATKKILTAQELAEIAERKLVEKTETEGKELFTEIGQAVSQVPEAGQYSHIVEFNSGITSKAITFALKELRAYGYTVKKLASPGKGGVEIVVKWPTTTKKKTKKTKPASKPQRKRGRPKKRSNSPKEPAKPSAKSSNEKESPPKPVSE